MLRGFYALEQTRTVFVIQCAVAATNILAAVLLVAMTDDRGTSPALVGAYTCAYLVGSLVSALVLRRVLGGLGVTGGAGWPSYLGRLLVAVVASTALALGVRLLLPDLPDDPSTVRARAASSPCSPASPCVAFLAVARLLRINEVTSVLSTVLRRTRTS